MEADIHGHSAAGSDAGSQTVQPAWRRSVIWFADRELWWITLPVAAMIFVNQLPWDWVALTVLIVPAIWLLRLAATGSLTVRTPLDMPILLVFCMALVGIYPSIDQSLSLPVLAKMLVEFGLFYSLVNVISSPRGAWEMARLLGAAGVAISLLALVNTKWITQKVFSIPAIYEQFPQLLPVLNKVGFHPNIVGGTLAILVPLNLGLFLTILRIWRRRRQDERRLPTEWLPENVLYLTVELTAALIIVGSTLILTQSRGAWLGVAAATVLMAVWLERRLIWALPFVGLIGLLVIYRVGVASVTDFFLISDVATSTQGRLELWGRAIYMMQDFPYTGIGLGTFEQVMPVMYPVFIFGSKVPHAHNLWLQMGIDLGLPGLVAYTAFLAALMGVAWQAVRQNRGRILEPLALGCAGAFTAFLVHGLVDYVTFSTKPGTALWAVLGLTTAVWRVTRHHSA